MQDVHPELPSVEQSSSYWPTTAASTVRAPIGDDLPVNPGGVAASSGRSAEASRRHDALLEAVEFSAECLLSTAHWDDHLQEVLARVGAAADVSRVYVAENRLDDDDTPLVSWRCEWVAPGITPRIDDPRLQNLPLRSTGFARWIDLMRQGKVVAGPVRTIPSGEWEALVSREVRSLALVPILVGSAWWGFIGFEECRSEREWSAAEIGTFRTVARTLGAAILHQRAQAERVELLFREQSALAEADLVRQRLAFLASASTILSSSLDYAATLAQVARLVVPFLADVCAVNLVERDGTVCQLELACADQSWESSMRAIERRRSLDLRTAAADAHPIVEVLRHGESRLWSEVTDELLEVYARDRDELDLLRQLSPRSLMIVPLIARERVLGAMTFLAAESNRTYSAIDLALAEDLARRCALAIDNALLYQHTHQIYQRLVTLFDQLGSMAVFVDHSERICMVTRACCTFFGFAEPEATGRSLRELRERANVRNADGSPSSYDESPSREAMTRRQTVRRLCLVATPFGDRVVETISAPIVDDRGTVMGALTILRDATEQPRSNDFEREIVSTVAHDLRNPLGIILGHAQHHLLELAHHSGDREYYENQLQSSLRAIVRQVNRMTRLVELYLDMARIESGRLQLRPEPTDLARLLRSVVDRFRAHTLARTIVLDVPTESVVAWIEAERIDQVLNNLIDNAIAHTTEGGEIRVTLRTVRDRGVPEAEIAVEDNGAGISSDDLPRLFTRFFRTLSPTRRTRRGTGLGLYICKGIVEAHGGRIWATSEGPDRGSRFAFTLPLEPWGEPDL